LGCRLMSYAYRLLNSGTMDAAEDQRMAAILCGGPWCYSLDGDGVICTHPGEPRSSEAYGQPVPVDGVDGLFFLPPMGASSLYDYARPDVHGGVDLRLACGLTVSIPVALVQHRQLLIGGRKPVAGDPVTEYGRLAARLYASASGSDGLQMDDPTLGRLLILALAQHYRVTAHMIDHLGVLSVDDVDPILGAVWCGDPKALAPVSAGGLNASPTSG
jgi:hypothetical protein